MIIRPFGISVHLQTNPISTPHARVTEWRDVITKRATLLTTQTWSRSRPLSWADAIGRIWWQVVAIYRGRIEIDHSYGLRCRGLCWHLRHSTRGTGRRGRKRPRDGRSHSCCAGGVSTNHSSADRIVVNSYSHDGVTWWVRWLMGFPSEIYSVLYGAALTTPEAIWCILTAGHSGTFYCGPGEEWLTALSLRIHWVLPVFSVVVTMHVICNISWRKWLNDKSTAYRICSCFEDFKCLKPMYISRL